MGHESSASKITAQKLWPVFLVVLIITLQVGLINLLQLISHTKLYPVVEFAFLGDLGSFIGGGTSISLGRSPYLDPRLVTPPFFPQLIFLIINLMTNVGAPLGLHGFFWANLACIFINISLVAYLFIPSGRAIAISVMIAGALSSYPVLMLLDRGNIDAWVIFFMLVGLLGFSRNSYFTAGSCLACAIASKVYPIILLAPLFLQLQIRTILWCGFAGILIYCAAPEPWQDFLTHRLLDRWQQTGDRENGSLLRTTHWLFRGSYTADEVTSIFQITAIFIIASHLALDLFSNRRLFSPLDRSAWLLMYIPLMLAFPKTVYHYCFWSMLLMPATYAYLLTRTRSPFLRALVALSCIGVGLSQFPGIAFESLDMPTWRPQLIYGSFIPGFGALIVLLCHIPLKALWLKEMPVAVRGETAVPSPAPTCPP